MSTFTFIKTDINGVDIAPIEGIEVSLCDSDGDVLDSSNTNEDGEVSFTLSSNTQYLLKITESSRPNFDYIRGMFGIKKDSLGNLTSSTFRLSKAIKLENVQITVTDHTGTPVEDVTVTVTPNNTEFSEVSLGTNPSGVALFVDVPIDYINPTEFKVSVDFYNSIFDFFLLPLEEDSKNYTLKVSLNTISEQSVLSLSHIITNEVVTP